MIGGIGVKLFNHAELAGISFRGKLVKETFGLALLAMKKGRYGAVLWLDYFGLAFSYKPSKLPRLQSATVSEIQKRTKQSVLQWLMKFVIRRARRLFAERAPECTSIRNSGR